jgi:hypothetical protein
MPRDSEIGSANWGQAMTKRSYGDGGIDQRGENSFRLRYRIGKQRYSVTFKGTLAEAKAELRRLLRSGERRADSDDTGPVGGTLDLNWLSKFA